MKDDLPQDIRAMAATVTVALLDLRPTQDEAQNMVLTLCRAVYASGEAKGIEFALRRAEAVA